MKTAENNKSLFSHIGKDIIMHSMYTVWSLLPGPQEQFTLSKTYYIELTMLVMMLHQLNYHKTPNPGILKLWFDENHTAFWEFTIGRNGKLFHSTMDFFATYKKVFGNCLTLNNICFIIYQYFSFTEYHSKTSSCLIQQLIST